MTKKAKCVKPREKKNEKHKAMERQCGNGGEKIEINPVKQFG